MSQQAAVYLLPDPDVGPASEPVVRAAMAAIGASNFRNAAVYRGAGDWRTPGEEYDLVASLERLTLDDFVAAACRRWDTLLAAEADIEPMMAIVRSVLRDAPPSIQRWVPQFGRLMVGQHSIPDYEFEETAWEGHFSVSIYGNRMPEEPDVLVSLLEADPQWNDLAARLGDALGRPVITRMEVSY